MKETTHYAKVTDLPALAAVVLERVHRGIHQGEASVIALSGDLGAGKTTFIQTLARVLLIGDMVTSPTFTVIKQYAVSHQNVYGIERLVHIWMLIDWSRSLK